MNPLPCESRCGSPTFCPFPTDPTPEERAAFIKAHPSRYGQSVRSKAYDRLLTREGRGAER